MWLLVVAAIFHLICVLSIFDIYFSSPIDPDLENVIFSPGSDKPPAKRLVFMIADGLRADTCFEFLGRDERFHQSRDSLGKISARESHYQAALATWPTDKTSFLRGILEESGSWGVSHARVPTETRPGHVALIAGFYEDVSAVTKGWQDNPVEFDHVFNQSKHTWAWGSPDVTRMFAKKLSHVHDYYYSAEEEDFAKEDLTMLDTWVFNRVAKMFKDSEANATLYNQMHEEKVIFFLHLLGLDCNGHAHRPQSPEYHHNMATLDRGIAGVYHLFQEYFSDGETAYVLSSDHGMGNKGAHGDGDPTNTRTPIIAWGAGIEPSKVKRKIKGQTNSTIDTGFSVEEEDGFTEQWGLSHLERRDIEQADIAPLLSSLIGIPVPANSIGVLPLAHLKRNNYRAKAYISNAKQLVKQVEFKESDRKNRLLCFFPFEGFQKALPELNAAVRAYSDEDYEEAERLCANVMQVCKEALRYYQTYDRFYLLSLIILGYFGWIGYTATEITFYEEPGECRSWTNLSLFSLFCFGVLFIIQIVEKAPINYFAYWLFPAFFWTITLRKQGIYTHWISLLRENNSSFPRMIVYLIGLQLMVLGYTYREIYTVIFCGMGYWIFTIPELAGRNKVSFQSHTGKIVSFPAKAVHIAWFALCFIIGIFTLLPLEINDNSILMGVGTALVLENQVLVYSTDIVGFSWFRFLQVSLIICSTVTTFSTDASLRAKSGLPLLNQGLTWFCFIIAQFTPPYSYKTPLKRFLSVFAALATPLILLSVNYEVLFYGFLGATMYLWLIVERCIMFARKQELEVKTGPQSMKLHRAMASLDDVRTAFFFVLFVHISFFGTGNIASLSSFQISSTYRFITVFSPFLMGGLLIYKILLPYAMLATVVTSISKERIVGQISKLTPSQWFLLVLLLTDTMALNLLFWVRDEGSWKDIGTSISQFGFINAQVLFVPFIFWLSSYYMKGLEFGLADLTDSKQT